MKAISIFLFIACLQSAHAADGTLYRCQGEKGASYSSAYTNHYDQLGQSDLTTTGVLISKAS